MEENDRITFTVEEYSSEDTKFRAANLSDSDVDTPWTSSSAGTTQEFVTLKLETPSKLQSIHVVNNFSGLLEVQATKYSAGSSSKKDEWQTIVSKSSLMTPMDARAKKNGHVKRHLTLLPLAEEHEWSILKFICHQPFSKELPYGLSKIQISAVDTIPPEKSVVTQQNGGFSLRKKTDDNEIEPGSLFASSLQKNGETSENKHLIPSSSSRKSKSKSPSPKPTTTRTASVKTEDSKRDEVDKIANSLKPLSLKRKAQPLSEDEKPSSSREDKKSKLKTKDSSPKRSRGKNTESDDEDDNSEVGKMKNKKTDGKAKSPKRGRPPKKQTETDDDDGVDSKQKARTKKPSPKKRRKDEEEDTDNDQPRTSKKKGKEEKTKTGRPRTGKTEDNSEDEEVSTANRPVSRQGNRKDVMKGCIIALSGFVNPLRGELRENATEMGAKYRPNWTDDCTHLICAFANTPKYNEVRAAGGRILKKEWVEDSYKNKKMMPWRNYMLKPAKQSQDDEIDELEEAKFDEDEEWEPDKADEDVVEDDEEEEDFSDEEEAEDIKKELKDPDDDFLNDDEEETDEGDEIDELPLTLPGKSKSPKKKVSPVKRRKGGVHFHGDDTDTDMSEGQLGLTDAEEADIPAEKFVPRARPLFRSCGFFLFGDFSEDERKKLESAIKDLAGEVLEYNDEKVTHCVTQMNWCPEFNEAKAENPTLAIVQPSWVYKCQEKMSLLDPRDFKPKKGS